MNFKINIKKNLFPIFLILSTFVYSDYNGPTDPAADISNVRAGRMNGNRILLYFKNTTQQADWDPSGLWDVSIWPNDGTGTRMLDGIGLLLGAKVFIQKDSTLEVDTLIIDDIDYLNSLNAEELEELFHTVHFLQTDYREEVDLNPTGEIKWTLYPVSGYFNPLSETPAMSNNSASWPNAWPSTGTETKWPGEWDGRFGRGVRYADLATYFVANDAQDQEWVTYWECETEFYDNKIGCEQVCESVCEQLGNSLGYSYLPRPGSYIQNDATKQAGLPWGGLGVRVEARGFQWNNPLVRDALFWEYNISNISDYNIPYMGFGYWVDNGIGGESDIADENGWFDTDLDLSYTWDADNTGFGGIEDFGIMGFAYLESPSLSNDGIDNDNDGIIDESRDNGIDDDGDWVGPDLNEDGSFDCSNLNDDVGLDGVGPNNLNYWPEGPDADGTECNGVPDCIEGVGCEPNIDETDISESDMIGLTTFQLFPIDEAGKNSPTGLWFENDDIMWNMISDTALDQFELSPENLVELFASATFPLEKGKTERISMAELHSFDQIIAENLDIQPELNLFQLKSIVQVVYESDYRFASPPELPTLKAEASDGKVVLTWDDIAEQSFDNFLPKSELLTLDHNGNGEYDCGDIPSECDEFEDLNGNEIWDAQFQFDFEGYKIYKSTDKYLQDAQVITDGYGNLMFKEPLFQCDKINGVKGFANWAPISGTSVYMGNDSGIRHTYTDTDVDNGRTYYYAIVAYDYGMASAGELASGIPPAENNTIIELDANEYIISLGQNVVEVRPTFNAAGYVETEINIDYEDLIGTGSIEVVTLLNSELNSNTEYLLTFTNELTQQYGLSYFTTNGFNVFKVSDTLELIYTENSSDFEGENLVFYDLISSGGFPVNFWSLNSNSTIQTDLIDGFRLEINAVDTVSIKSQGWTNIESSYIPSLYLTKNQLLQSLAPWDISINFLYQGESYFTKPLFIAGAPITDENNEEYYINPWDPSSFKFLYEFDASGYPYTKIMQTNFYIYNETLGDTLDFVIWDTNDDDEFNLVGDKIVIGTTRFDTTWNAQVWNQALGAFIITNSETIPSSGDKYELTFERPFWNSDTISIHVGKTDTISNDLLDEDMDLIKVVPNPYIATNLLEESIFNPNFNQRRKLMFTHIPLDCQIKIYTVSGVFVDQIDVNNSGNDGIAYWDLLNNEGLEIAAGMYIYHLKSNLTKNVKMGKFSIIK